MDLIWNLDNAGVPLTGGAASTELRIRRDADGYLLDWHDLTFKAGGWTTPATALSEIDSTNFPGAYKKTVTVTAWNDGYYQVLTKFTGTPKQEGIKEFYLVDGITTDERIGAVATIPGKIYKRLA